MNPNDLLHFQDRQRRARVALRPCHNNYDSFGTATKNPPQWAGLKLIRIKKNYAAMALIRPDRRESFREAVFL